MSGSQEAADAVRRLERTRAEYIEKVEAVKKSIRSHDQMRDQLVVQLGHWERQVGQVEGALATFNGPRGYGGGPALSYREYAERERARVTGTGGNIR
jgi:hypothetical protein